jgi:hypothetical protein
MREWRKDQRLEEEKLINRISILEAKVKMLEEQKSSDVLFREARYIVAQGRHRADMTRLSLKTMQLAAITKAASTRSTRHRWS